MSYYTIICLCDFKAFFALVEIFYVAARRLAIAETEEPEFENRLASLFVHSQASDAAPEKAPTRAICHTMVRSLATIITPLKTLAASSRQTSAATSSG